MRFLPADDLVKTSPVATSACRKRPSFRVGIEIFLQPETQSTTITISSFLPVVARQTKTTQKKENKGVMLVLRVSPKALLAYASPEGWSGACSRHNAGRRLVEGAILSGAILRTNRVEHKLGPPPESLE